MNSSARSQTSESLVEACYFYLCRASILCCCFVLASFGILLARQELDKMALAGVAARANLGAHQVAGRTSITKRPALVGADLAVGGGVGQDTDSATTDCLLLYAAEYYFTCPNSCAMLRR